jgi:hypothetical protein
MRYGIVRWSMAHVQFELNLGTLHLALTRRIEVQAVWDATRQTLTPHLR